MMFDRRCGLAHLAAVAFLVAATIPLGLRSSYAQASCRSFTETGNSVCGLFLEYWDAHGGLAQQGYPISGEMSEVSETDGKSYTVQYFERAVFEHHPENAAPNDVLLSLLGNFLYKEKYPDGAPGQTPNASAGSVLFPETGKRIGGKFLEYWQTNGGLAQQGYPISDEFTEVSALNGKSYTVQYFERAVFEHHPENEAPYDVLLSQLGTFRYRARDAGTPATVTATAVPPSPSPSPTTSTESPTPTPVPSGPYAATAQVSDPTPLRRTVLTLTGRLLRGGQPIQGAVMNSVWHYKSTNTPCDGQTTDANGEASCRNNIGGATVGFAVNIDVSFVVDGQVVATAKTSFTPRQ